MIKAARDAIARTKAQYEERLHQIERGAAQLLAGVRTHEKALRREFGRATPEEHQIATLHMNGLLITARARELTPDECRALVEASETVLGPEGIGELRQGNVSLIPGETYQEQADTALHILNAYEKRGIDQTAALERVSADLDRFQKAEQRKSVERSKSQVTFLEKPRDRGHDDDWDL